MINMDVEFVAAAAIVLLHWKRKQDFLRPRILNL